MAERVRAEALTRGIRQATIDEAFTGLEPLPVVVERDRTQAELVLTLDRYLQQHLTKKVIATAAAMRRTHADVLKQVQDKIRRASEIVVAIWGLESNFGRFSGRAADDPDARDAGLRSAAVVDVPRGAVRRAEDPR